ncbi:MAG: sensor histidine kinase [Lachnospiraceae bacterium]|nr:sensor histidine kinase [Lachnospiraceae bacterium]
MSKAKSFRTKLWLYFILFATVIFVVLWLLQTVFLQSFYNGMLKRNTREAAEEIAVSGKKADFTALVDQLSSENSLLVFITDLDGSILHSSDAYKSYYHASESYKEAYQEASGAVDGEDSQETGGNPYRHEETDVGSGKESQIVGAESSQENLQDGSEAGGSESSEAADANPYRHEQSLNWQVGNYRNLPDGYDEFLEELKASSEGRVEYSTDSQFVYGRYMELEDEEKAVLYTSVTLGAVGAAASIIRTQLIWVTLLSILLAFVIAWFLARKFAIPVKQLSKQAKMLSGEDYKSIFEKGFCSELDDLSDSLDQTAGELKEARNYQKELLANVSHDLRTPLTMIKGYAEMVRDVSWEDEKQRNADTEIIIREADRLTALVNEILEYTRLQSRNLERELVDLDFTRLVENVVGQFEPLLSREGGTVESDIEEGCRVCGDSRLLTRAVYNLVDNAIRHMGDEKKISVSLHGKDKALLEVRDYGEGITEEELPHIWEKYYTSRQRGRKGVSGLGLAIVKEIAEIHGADYGVESRKGEGSRFWISLK